MGFNTKTAQNRHFSTKSSHLSHIDESTGRAKMVDISDKQITSRTASAIGKVWVGREVCQLIRSNELKKGDALTVAQIAGIMASKHTSKLIPLCHEIALENVSVDLIVDSNNEEIVIRAMAKTRSQTGVEMEALTAVSIAALTVYDMCKALNKRIIIREIKLISKTGGKQDLNFE
jgi:molybdenum cofactor biosynthesis protein MoaC